MQYYYDYDYDYYYRRRSILEVLPFDTDSHFLQILQHPDDYYPITDQDTLKDPTNNTNSTQTHTQK
jgi:hypothetical protein